MSFSHSSQWSLHFYCLEKQYFPWSCIPVVSGTASTTDYMECTHSYLTVPPMLRYWNWYFVSVVLHVSHWYFPTYVDPHVILRSIIFINPGEHFGNFISPITLLSYIVVFTHTKPLFFFFQSYSSLLYTSVIRKYTNSSRYGRSLFIIYNKLEVSDWKSWYYLSQF